MGQWKNEGYKIKPGKELNGVIRNAGLETG
jgi:hypothetical protein